VLQPSRIKDEAFLQAIRDLTPDLGVVAAFGRILPDSLLAIPRLGMINVHASLLPRYRGAAPVHRAVLAGDAETGVTIMRVVKALDAGPMLAKVTRPIGVDETSDEVEADLARIGAELLASTVDALAAGRASETPQDEALATYAARLTKEEGLIDWSEPADRIHNLIRGLHPWPHAFTFLHAKRLILLRSVAPDPSPARAPRRSDPDQTSIRLQSDPSHTSVTVRTGVIVEAAGDRLVVATGSGPLQIRELQAEGKRPMTAREFLAGHRLTPGDRFSAAP
jgi:methionyl-tRNA formyltransferase